MTDQLIYSIKVLVLKKKNVGLYYSSSTLISKSNIVIHKYDLQTTILISKNI